VHLTLIREVPAGSRRGRPLRAVARAVEIDDDIVRVRPLLDPVPVQGCLIGDMAATRGSRTVPIAVAEMQVSRLVDLGGHNKNRLPKIAAPPIGLR
jgi:hypothetical protein